MRQFDRDKLRKLRISKGYSLEKTARLLALVGNRKVCRSAVSHWENGQTTPSLESLLALSELFSEPMDSFFVPRPNSLLGTKRGLDSKGSR